MKYISILALTFLSFGAFAQPNYENLENVNPTTFSDQQWNNLEASLSSSAEKNEPVLSEACVDASHKVLRNKYAVSFDSDGQLCRVYDLTFPHLKMLISNFTEGQSNYTSLPALNFTARDYENWIDGKYELVYNQITSFQSQSINRKHNKVAPWLKNIKFKKGSTAFGFAANSHEIPQSFYASDLQIGTQFKLSTFRKNQLIRVINSLAKSHQNAADYKQWVDLIEKPAQLLNKIRFNWNDAKKVYDIALEGQFLPINGPIALINFDRPHKVFVEGLLRRVVKMALDQVTNRIPGANSLIITFALNEAFIAIDSAYQYQMNRLEHTFKNIKATGSLVMTIPEVKRSLNHIYLSQVNLVNEVILRMAQGMKFPWNQLEKMGRNQHFQVEKSRDVMMDHSNNYLVKKKSCQTHFSYEYFATCNKGDSEKLYTLISQFSLFGYNFGPSEVFNFKKPNNVLAKKSVSYLLSAGLIITQTIVPRWITSNLASFLRQYALSGTNEEAYLLSQLAMKDDYDGLPLSEANLMNALYLQNLNIFTPKSASMEESFIKTNKKLLGIN